MLLQQSRHLGGTELALNEPLGIVVVPDQAVSANFHAVRLSEVHDFVGRMKIKALGSSPDDLPFHRVFRFDHVEFTTQRCSVCDFGKESWTDRSAEEDVRLVGGLSKRYAMTVAAALLPRIVRERLNRGKDENDDISRGMSFT